MQRNDLRGAARAATGLLMAAALLATPLARAQAPAQPDVPPVDPTFSAWSLVQLCQHKNDNVAQGECTGAVRGIIHGYQYGVLFLGQRVSMPEGETRNVSLCLRGTSVSSIVDDFVGDARQVSDDALKRTPAEVAVLGSVHAHHACS